MWKSAYQSLQKVHKLTRLAFFVFVLTASDVKSEVVLGNKQNEIRESSISHCSKKQSRKHIIDCLVSSGDNYKSALEFSERSYFHEYHQLCKINTDSLPDSWYHYTACLSNAAQITLNHPIPELYTVHLDRARYRSEWAASCLKQVGRNISPCLQKKEQHLTEFISIYMSITKNEAQRITRCANGDLIRTGEFEAINACIRNPL